MSGLEALVEGDDRDYVGYGPRPPVVEWPGSARLAVSICVNYEEGSERSIYFGDSVDESLGEWASYSSPGRLPAGERNRTNESFTEYGSRVGVWRLLELFERYQTRVTFLACAVALERNPEAGRAIVSHGHEVCSHGYRWENHYGLTVDEESERIEMAAQSLESTTGVRPVGWYSREGLTPNTRELLIRHGFLYDSNSYADDIPYFVRVREQRHLIVPYSGDTNDVHFWLAPGYANAHDFFVALKDTADWLLTEGERLPRMMSVGLHLRISGRPGRIVAVERFLDYVAGRPEIWVARRDEIARWWIDHAPS